jgi:hypothetical protein
LALLRDVRTYETGCAGDQCAGQSSVV